MNRVLIIEDEKDLAELLAFNLEKEGYAATCIHDGKLGLEQAVADVPDLILLDLMLPGLLGTEVCKALRKDLRTSHIPIIMITAKGDEIDRVVGFEVGADDYIVKPFSMREVALRVKAVMRRFEHEVQTPTADLVSIGDIVIDTQRHTVMSAGLEIELTSTEFKLLLYMAEKKGCVQSREQLLQKVWSYNNAGDTRTVDTHVTRLRGKLGAPGDIIKTVRGFGYKIEGMTMGFRTKLVLSYIFLIALITGSFYLYFNHTLQKGMIEESRANLASQTQLARLLVMSDKRVTPPQQLAESIGTVIKARVTLIAPDGTVIGDSDVGQARLSQMENHLQRPEVQEALKSGSGSAVRYSDTLRTSMLYSTMTYGSGATDGVIRLAMPLEYLASARETLHGLVGGATLVTLLIGLMFSYFLSNLTSRPLRDMADAAARIGHGGSKAKIPVVSNDEIGMLAGVLNDMSERIEDQVQRLSAEKQRLDTILRSMGEGVMVTAPDGVITLVNPAFRRLFSITGEVEGKKLVEISRHPDLLEAFNDLGKPEVHELVREIAIQPSDCTLFTHWVPLNVDGVRQGVVAVFHDISDLKKAENMRRDFVANVSHELRTPVTVIKGYAETLLDGALESDPVRSKRFVEIIASHSERLTNLINDILTLSSLESKEAILELNPMDVSGTIAKACMLLQEGAVQKNITILNESIGGILPRVMADQGRLEQVVVNLLENAIKYTPDCGSVRLFTEDDDAFIRVSVADTGIGIPFKDLPRIFERFYRVDEARTREQGGTGLGLAIVKHIVQLHGGNVSVTSLPGQGSVFSFTLKKVS